MRKLYYLSTCSTCQRIMKELGDLIADFEMQDIKQDRIELDQVDQMKELAGSYEALFSRKAMKYRSMGLNERTLAEDEYRQLIHEEYTFLKRPVFIIGDEVFVGNSKKEIARLADYLG